MDRWRLALTFAAMLGCGLVAGVLFAFSAFVMPALGRLPPPRAVAAMQSINIAAVTPVFMLALFGAAATCVLLAVTLLRRWKRPANACALAGCGLYLAGAMGVTFAFNIPLNNALASVAPESAHAAGLWARYLADWTAWNHARALAAFAAAASLAAALYRWREA